MNKSQIGHFNMDCSLYSECVSPTSTTSDLHCGYRNGEDSDKKPNNYKTIGNSVTCLKLEHKQNENHNEIKIKKQSIKERLATMDLFDDSCDDSIMSPFDTNLSAIKNGRINAFTDLSFDIGLSDNECVGETENGLQTSSRCVDFCDDSLYNCDKRCDYLNTSDKIAIPSEACLAPVLSSPLSLAERLKMKSAHHNDALRTLSQSSQ